MAFLRLPTLRLVADVITILLGVFLIGVLAVNYLPRVLAPEPMPADVRLDGATIGVDFSASDRTLLLILQQDCPFCHASLPFYRTLTAQDTSVPIVAVAPAYDTGIQAYLDAASVSPDAVRFVDDNQTLLVTGTPTLLLVDSTGLVTHAWLGQLDAERETEVLRLLR